MKTLTSEEFNALSEQLGDFDARLNSGTWFVVEAAEKGDFRDKGLEKRDNRILEVTFAPSDRHKDGTIASMAFAVKNDFKFKTNTNNTDWTTGRSGGIELSVRITKKDGQVCAYNTRKDFDTEVRGTDLPPVPTSFGQDLQLFEIAKAWGNKKATEQQKAAAEALAREEPKRRKAIANYAAEFSL